MNNLIQRIDSIVGRIHTHPEYSLRVKNEKSYDLMEESQRGSLEMDIESEGKILSKKERDLFVKRMHEASLFLSENGVCLYSFSQLGHIMEPGKNEKMYRTSDIQFGKHGKFYFESFEDIPFRLDNLVKFLEDPEIHPVLRASNAHLELVRIHPYNDGNRRSARVLQNFILQQRAYPPAVIGLEEMSAYEKLLWGSVDDRIERRSAFYAQSPTEEEFHEFIASKVLESAEDLERELRKRRTYCICMDHVKEPGISMSVARSLRNISRRENDGKVSVSRKQDVQHSKGQILDVIGDVSYGELQRVMKFASERYGFGYDIERGYC